MSWKELCQTWHYAEKWAGAQPQAEVFAFETQRWTWQAFKTEMDAVAAALLDIGVARGERVAYLAMARPEFLTTYIAANKIGAVWLGLNPKLTLDELRYLLQDSRPAVLIAMREYLGADLGDTLRTLGRELPFLKKILVIGEAVPGAETFAAFVARPRPGMVAALQARAGEATPDDPALLMYTSGSTGKPKGVLHTHRSIIENVRVQIAKFGFHQNTRALLHFPVNHVAADVEIGFASIMAGSFLALTDRFDPLASLQLIEKERLTLVGQIPAMFLLQMKLPAFAQTDFSSVEKFIWSGAAAPKIMLDGLHAICRRTGAKLMTGYGSTEVCGFVTYSDANDSLELLAQAAGRIAAPFELKIVDANRASLPAGEVGEIAVRGPFLFKEYLNKPEETASVKDSEGWYYTGDLARQDADGNIFIAGRKSEMYKTGGENVFPREIEEVLESHPDVLFAAVIGVPDETYQEVGCAFVMVQPGRQVMAEALEAHCRQQLANFKIPRRFLIRPVLPLLPTGKVDKLALKREIAASPPA